ncbi:MAG: hypothetical protein HXX19_06515 [Rhodoferax sp.]|nr:hypothetical protein [Rhodoferax sp.]
MPALSLKPVNANVYSVHQGDGAHVGNLKRVDAVWKFKAVGYDTDGSVVPGGGPYTERHNTQLAKPDAEQLSAALSDV